jgi:CHAT domain/NB-ARC domain
VEPGLASNVLLHVSSEVSKIREDLEVQVEVVRPGTLQALEQCLDSHPKGYFQLAHFDTHGKVATDRSTKTKQAYLLLDSGKSSGKVAPVKASTVGRLLAKHGVRLCILNSCDSAKANFGDSANLAAVFVKEGVFNVAAMSFHLLESAAKKFLEAFYEALLLKQNTFSIALSTARAAPRNDKSRRAKLNLSRTLQDWVIPITYASGEDARVLRDIPSAANTLEVSTLRAKDTIGLVGRDFDILRFERSLLSSGVVCLCGNGGVGKTALILKAANAWKQTNFCDMLMAICLAEEEIRDSEALATLILRKIVGEEAADQIAAQVRESTEPRSLQQVVIRILRSHRCILVLESLEFTHCGLPASYLPTSLWDAEQQDIANFLAEASAASNDPDGDAESDFPIKLILVYRSTLPADWDFHFQPLKSKSILILPALKLSDAMGLGKRILDRAEIPTKTWKHADIDQLELIVSMLQCNPLAMEIVLPTVATPNWRDAMGRLMPDRLTSFPGLLNDKRMDMIREMIFLWPTFTEEQRSVLKYLTLYWGSGPFLSGLEQAIEKLHLCSAAEVA